MYATREEEGEEVCLSVCLSVSLSLSIFLAGTAEQSGFQVSRDF